jgi:hypothetical protein
VPPQRLPFSRSCNNDILSAIVAFFSNTLRHSHLPHSFLVENPRIVSLGLLVVLSWGDRRCLSHEQQALVA